MITKTLVSNQVHLVLDRLACPDCRTGLNLQGDVLQCSCCAATYPIVGGVIGLRTGTHETVKEAWSQHWSDEWQRSISQRFFSVYRKEITARLVRFLLGRYFPEEGVFIEAGSGTSETSMRVDKHGGARTLVATDIVPPVLRQCHPVMDVRVCGDIFHMPYRDDSLDGIWNVGVMEHFTHDEIDQILREFHRVLRPGARVILLWPGVDSIPQRMLRVAEAIMNLKPRPERFRFHPEEISQLRSLQEGSDVLTRNGFHPLLLDFGIRGLMGFKNLVGVKPQNGDDGLEGEPGPPED